MSGIPRFLCYYNSKPYFAESLSEDDWDLNKNGELIIVDIYAQNVFIGGKHEPVEIVGVASRLATAPATATQIGSASEPSARAPGP